MRKLWLVVKREYLTRVKTKGFVIATILVPIASIALFVIPIVLATRQSNRTLKIAILDDTGGLSSAVAKALNEKLPNGQPAYLVVKTIERPSSEDRTRKELLQQINSGQLDGYLYLPKDATRAKTAEFHTRNTGDFRLEGAISRAVTDAVIARRLSDGGMRVDNLKDVIRGLDITMVKVTQAGETEERGQTFITAIVLAMLLYMTLVMYGIVTMRSVLEEKTTRIVEVLISAVTPFQLLGGKILGVAAVAFTQYFVWITSAWLLKAYGSAMAGSLAPGVTSAFHLPGTLLIFLIVYFLLGYFLYASLYAAIGAAASNEQDAQQMQLPATLPLVASIILFNMILRDPNSTASVVLSEIPFFTPILMLLRISMQPPPIWQIALSIVLLILTAVGVIYFSARIYRVGILMHGKRPSLVEILRWLRYT